jgi:carbon storage regulator
MSDITRLVLTRKVYQSIKIGGLISVTVEEVRGKTVRIAVQAPRGIAVHRQEIYERIVGADPDEDGGAGRCVPAGPVTGPDRPASRSLASGVLAARAVVATAVGAAEDRPAVGLPPGGGGDDGL